MLKAPFNFAPLPEKVVLADWAELVSQDVPFSDGVSGVIEVNIEAKTDIFVRNGHALDKRESKFSQVGNNCYFIPGTTLKGCLRSVLEIASFGKIKQYNKHSFAIRDLRNNAYKQLIQKNPTHAGWMYRSGGEFYIHDAGEVENKGNRISAKEIDTKLKISEGGFYSFITKGPNSSQRDASFKYKKLAGLLSGKLEKEMCDKIGRGEAFYEIDGKYLVFTGQPNRRERKHVWVGKGKEFLFKKYPKSFNTETSLTISEEDIRAFQSIHASSDDYTEFWKEKLDKGLPIPVFFQEVNEHHYIGLSFMFKYPTKENVESAIGNTYGKLADKPDLADVIFGYVNETESLKGRVVVGHAFAEQASCQTGNERITLMATPRPSYYPLYLKWNKQPVSWNDTYGQKIEIAGYKRYPVRAGASSDFPKRLPNQEIGKMESTMIPLKAGAKFQGRIMFHNLRGVELGALLYAITLGNSDKRYHNLGAYKPYGYGKIKIGYELKTVNGDSDLKSVSDKGKTYYDKYVKFMNDQVVGWESTPTIRELLRMAEGIPSGREPEFAYMKLSNDKKENEFIQGKQAYNEGERLGLFSEIIDKAVKKGNADGNNAPASTAKHPSAGNRPSAAKKYSKYSIKSQQQQFGWELEEREEYSGMITDRNILIVYYPGYDRNKNIRCDYQLEEFSKRPKRNSRVNFELVEIVDDSTICINVT